MPRGVKVIGARSRRVSAVNFISIRTHRTRHGKLSADCERCLPGFRKGSGHPARLNFGDCFAYALAKESGEPLLFKGGDFAHTDIVVALPAEP